MNILTAAYFARTETLNSFCEAVGLNKPPSQYVWFGVVAALGLQLLSHIVHSLGWNRGHLHYDFRLFQTTEEPERYLYLFGLLAAPFAEEPVYRGFLYKAFRGSYAMVPSVMVVLGYTVYTHWDQYQNLGWAVISLGAITIVQCYLREKSASLWDCIFMPPGLQWFHFDCGWSFAVLNTCLRQRPQIANAVSSPLRPARVFGSVIRVGSGSRCIRSC